MALYTGILLVGLLMHACRSSAAIVYSEFSQSGDLSDDPANPTVISDGLDLGENDVELSTSGSDPDYFTLTVANGTILTGIFLVGFESGEPGGNVGFIGFQDGNSISPDPPAPFEIAFFLYSENEVSDLGFDPFPFDFIDAFSESDRSTVVDGVLPAGDYTFWVNETNAAANTSAFVFVVEAIPEPSLYTLFSISLLASCGLRRRKINY